MIKTPRNLVAIPDPPWETKTKSTGLTKTVPEVSNFQLQKLTVHPYEWQIIDGKSSEEKTELRAWCLDRKSNPYLLRVTDYPIYAHLELPKVIAGSRVNWNDTKIRAIYDYLHRKLGKNKPRGYKLFKANKLYYYQDPRDPTIFMRLFFNNIKSMRACKNHLNYPRRITGIGSNIKLSLHETQIPSVRKMLTEKECKYSQWFNSQGRNVTEEEKVSTLKREFIINWKSIVPLNVNWTTNPGILAFDIESYSKNRAAFPDAWNPSDDAYMISCIYQRVGREDTLRKILIIYGVSSPPSDGDEYVFVSSEEDMCFKFAEIVRELDPEIITGYNIFGFDYPYLNKRLVRKGLKWPAMGRLLHSKETVMGGNTWSSSGYGHNSIKYLDMDGRINVDMMHIIKREHKLPTYTLEAVGQHFLGAGKNDVPAEMMFDIVTLMKMLQDVLETFREPAENGGDEKIPQILFALKTSDSIIEYIRRKQAEKHMLSPKEYNQIIQLVEYVLDEMNKIAKYCIKDSVLVLNLFSKLNVWVYLIQLSNVAGVTPLQLFTRGQQIRGLSLIYDLAARSGFVLDSRHYTPMSWSGGFVWEPIPGLWHWVICLDFKSLYPNIIRAYNICWTTLIPSWSAIKDDCCNIIEWDEPIDKEDYIKEGDDPDENGTGKKKIPPGMGTVIIKMENGEEVRYIHYRFRFLKKEYREGLLPQQAGMLIDERNKIRAAMKSITDPGELNIMNQRQLGMKVTANSLFGLLGAGEHGKLPLVEGAMCITAKGRELIKFSNEYLVEKYNASIIYNDSVTGDTPLLVREIINGKPGCQYWIRIDHIFTATKTKKTKIRQIVKHYQVWSDQGWTQIKQVISHWTKKKIYRVSTHTGVVDVTEDHSLLDSSGMEVKPSSLKIGDTLLHQDLPQLTKSVRSGIFKKLSFKKSITSDFTQKLDAAKVFQLGRSLGCDVHLEVDIEDAIRLVIHNQNKNIYGSEIQKIDLISDGSKGQFVYDLETENHHFSAGVGRLVVHNTDSTMVQIPGVTNGPDCLVWGKKLELELSAIFPDPLYLEFEKAGRQLTIKKKMYLFWILNKLGELPRDKNGDPKYMAKGLPLARRDKSKWQLNLVRSALNMIIQEQPHREFLDMVIKYVITTLRGKHDWQLFSIIKSLGSGYKNQSYFMKVFADQLRLIGKPAKPGDRLKFVIVEPRDHPNDCLLGYKMRLLDTYVERINSDRPEKINYYYYINNLLMDCIDNYWRVGYKPIIDKIEAQNALDDKWKILNELKEIGLGNWVTSALNSNDQDPKRAVEALMLTKIKNKTIMARRKHISGRKVFDCRVSGKPIKTLLKGYSKDRLEEAVKSLASLELYNELYPKLKITGKNGKTIQLNIS